MWLTGRLRRYAPVGTEPHESAVSQAKIEAFRKPKFVIRPSCRAACARGSRSRGTGRAADVTSKRPAWIPAAAPSRSAVKRVDVGRLETVLDGIERAVQERVDDPNRQPVAAQGGKRVDLALDLVAVHVAGGVLVAQRVGLVVDDHHLAAELGQQVDLAADDQLAELEGERELRVERRTPADSSSRSGESRKPRTSPWTRARPACGRNALPAQQRRGQLVAGLLPAPPSRWPPAARGRPCPGHTGAPGRSASSGGNGSGTGSSSSPRLGSGTAGRGRRSAEPQHRSA